MAVRRPTGPLPLGNAAPGFRRVLRFPGAGERTPQSEIRGGAPPGSLPTFFGATGIKPFLPGRTSVKRSFQSLTNRRISPFFITTPPAVEAPGPPGFTPEAGTEMEVSDVPMREEKPAPKRSGKRGRIKVTRQMLAQIRAQRNAKRNG